MTGRVAVSCFVSAGAAGVIFLITNGLFTYVVFEPTRTISEGLTFRLEDHEINKNMQSLRNIAQDFGMGFEYFEIGIRTHS